MTQEHTEKLAFGPVPSRRLGCSLGINNIPHKTCTYSCVYCQIGRTRKLRIEPEKFCDPEQIVTAVRGHLRRARQAGQSVDYLTFVSDGEPTLDRSLGRTIALLKAEGVPVAVITNASLIDRCEVRDSLLAADWVSVKVDAADQTAWRRIDRPHRALVLPAILEGLLGFRERFGGTLVTETMLIRDLNDGDDSLRSIARFLGRLNPAVAYLGIPTRPPAEQSARPPREESIARAFQVFNSSVRRTEYLIGYEGNAFASGGDPREDLLAITAVHPMRRDAVEALLQKAGAEWSVVSTLIAESRLVEIDYDQHTFYLRKFPAETR